MSSYQYPFSGVVNKVVFEKSPHGGLRAYLMASNSAYSSKLGEVTAALKDKGFQFIATEYQGKSALEVRGLKDEASFKQFLEQKKFTSGKCVEVKSINEKTSWWDWVKNHSLQLTGAVFIAADLGFMKYGHAKGHWEDVAAGAAYLGGSSVFAGFGGGDLSHLELRKQARKLIAFADTHDLAVTPDMAAAMFADQEPKNIADKTISALRDYPAEIGNIITAIAGSMIAYSSFKHGVLKKLDPHVVGAESILQRQKAGESVAGLVAQKVGEESIRKKKWVSVMDMGLGLTTMASGLVAALVREQAPDPDAPKSKNKQSIIDWVKERPLRVAGYGYMISTLCHAASTFTDYKNAKKMHDVETRKAIPYRIMFIAATLVGELLLVITSKGHGDGVKADNSTDDTMISAAAGLIAKQPKEMHAGLVHEMAKFLGQPDVLALKDANVEELLAKRVETLGQNVWAKPSIVAKPAAQPFAAWQARIAGEAAVANDVAFRN